MSLKAIAEQTLARLHAQAVSPETLHETAMKKVKQSTPSCFTDAAPHSTPMKRAQPQETAVFRSCFTVSPPREGSDETDPAIDTLVASWKHGLALLDPERPPTGVLAEDWRRILHDADILMRYWAVSAAKLGWDALDLFGVLPGFPRRLDGHGLAVALCGRIVVALTADAATIDAGPSKPTRYYRRRLLRSVPLWLA